MPNADREYAVDVASSPRINRRCGIETLAPTTRVIDLEGTDFRRGLLYNPMLVKSSDQVSSRLFRTRGLSKKAVMAAPASAQVGRRPVSERLDLSFQENVNDVT